ncbi:Transposase [Sphingobium sp. YR768]|nr:Transposase [Sphingobium sp. YR768]
MNYYAGLDVSLEETAICIVDETGAIVRELRAPSDPESLISAFNSIALPMVRIGLEACSQSAWLHQGMARSGLPVLCIETRQAKAAMGAMPNKTDRNDARGLAQIIRTGWYRQVHVKSAPSRMSRSLLVARRTVLCKVRDMENAVRAVLRESGLKVGAPGRKLFATRVRELAETDPSLADITEPLLAIIAAMHCHLERLTRRVLEAVRVEPICRQLMTVPGVGPLTALAFRATVDRPDRFRRSRDVGAHLGLTPRRYQSGETDVQGRVSRCGDELARTLLYEAAHTLLTRCKKWSALKAWGMGIAKRRGMAKARVAVARKLAVILHRMWSDQTEFRWGRFLQARQHEEAQSESRLRRRVASFPWGRRARRSRLESGTSAQLKVAKQIETPCSP